MSDELIEAAVEVAREVPQALLERFEREVARNSAVPRLVGPAGERLCALGERWAATHPDGLAGLALALRVGAKVAAAERARQRGDLVWTGPHGERFGLLRIEESLLDIIDAVERRLLLVTFAAYEVDDVRKALARAAERGVDVTVITEHAKDQGGQVAFDPLPSLFGSELLDKFEAFYWPAETRPAVDGRCGTLHAKTLVGDDDELLVSSANFTGNALALNMELGVRVRGGPLPRRVREHFEELMTGGVLRKVG